MAKTNRMLVPAARLSANVLRRTFVLCAGHRAVRLITARIVAPALTAVERFLDARADAFSSRGWV
jgi:hypothetical protein